MRNLLTLFDLSRNDVLGLLDLASDLKSQFALGIREPLLSGYVLGLLFSKPSLRTRVSFEAAMCHLGGTSLYLGQDVGWGKREPINDFSRVLSQYTDVIVCRTHQHAMLEELARYAECPVINGLTDSSHPCQALADVMTIREEIGELNACPVTFVGDGNNVARSLATACKLLGSHFTLSAPAGYEFPGDFMERVNALPGTGSVVETSDVRAAVKNAAVIYTDVWSSMGQEAEQAKRAAVFAPYQVNGALWRQAPDAIFLHCLPARRGEEVTSDVIDGPQSRIVAQAANRMHIQKAILARFLDKA